MFGIFTNDSSTGYTPLLIDPNVECPAIEGPVIIRREQRADGYGRESELYHRARQIYYRGRRSSARRSAGII